MSAGEEALLLLSMQVATMTTDDDVDEDDQRQKLTSGSPFISPQVALTVKGPCVSSSTSSPSSRTSEKYML